MFAQLYTADSKYHGLNAFLVPIRCTKTFKPFPGILVGDLGEKIGLNGLDNGYGFRWVSRSDSSAIVLLNFPASLCSIRSVYQEKIFYRDSVMSLLTGIT